MSAAVFDTAVVLCGGRGTRLQEHARAIPKPLVEVGGLPIVWHVVSIFAAQGVERVLLLTGYRSELVEEFAVAADWPADTTVEHWVNGGFLACDPRFAGYLGPDLVLEREPLERLAADGGLHAHRHEGFWACMDTYKDAVRLNDLWASGDPPWRTAAS